jgi:hypothetical protein
MKRIIIIGLPVFLLCAICYGQFDFQYKLRKNYIDITLMKEILDILSKNNAQLESKQISLTGLKDNRFNLRGGFNLHQKEFLAKLGSEQTFSGNQTYDALIQSLKKKIEKCEVDYNKEKLDQKKPDFLRSGYIELFSNGTAKGSVQVFKIRIGEPSLYGYKRISIPLYFYLGATGNNLSGDQQNQKEVTFNDLLDPLGGMVNIHFYDVLDFGISKFQLTYLGFAYQLGAKIINGNDQQTMKNTIFANLYSSAGLCFQTAAWEEDQQNNMGVFWVQARVTGTVLSQSKLDQIFGENTMNSFLPGLAGDIGLFIDNRINLKLGVYKFFSTNKNSTLGFLNNTVFKFTVDYSTSNK